MYVRPLYGFGDIDEGIGNVQQELYAMGFPVYIDGIMGPQTAAALRAFQTARGIPVTGEIDSTTLAELAAAYAAGWTVPMAGPPVVTPAATAPTSAAGPTPVAPASAPTDNTWIWLAAGGLVFYMFMGKRG